MIKENVGSSLQCMGTGDHFLNITPIAQTLRATINKWDLFSFTVPKPKVFWNPVRSPFPEIPRRMPGLEK